MEKVTPIETAEKFIEKFYKQNHQPYSYRDAQSCALIAVNEIIEQLTHWCPAHILNYWMDVKKELDGKDK